MSKLPLKVQVGIRDAWAKDDVPVQKALSSLKETLGLDVAIEPEWHLLLAELDSSYPDKTVFVPSIAGCVRAWSTALTSLLDDGANEEWADTLLEHAEGRVRLSLEVSKASQPSLSWSRERVGFVINLPKSQLLSTMDLEPLFKGQLLTCFDENAAPPAALAHRSGPGDDWADISMDTATDKLVVTTSAPKAPTFDRLPDCNTLERPDDLLLKSPYHLVVYDRGSANAEVHGSHSPSLQLLADYLKKWCKINQQDSRKPPCVEVKLHQSAFGLGLFYDRLTLSIESRYTGFTISPMIVLSFVEGVLGYQNVSVDGQGWRFRKDVEFRRAGY
ncbi:hypothetical protein SCUP515_13036 [Seiridium cupressi]